MRMRNRLAYRQRSRSCRHHHALMISEEANLMCSSPLQFSAGSASSCSRDHLVQDIHDAATAHRSIGIGRTPGLTCAVPGLPGRLKRCFTKARPRGRLPRAQGVPQPPHRTRCSTRKRRRRTMNNLLLRFLLLLSLFSSSSIWKTVNVPFLGSSVKQNAPLHCRSCSTASCGNFGGLSRVQAPSRASELSSLVHR